MGLQLRLHGDGGLHEIPQRGNDHAAQDEDDVGGGSVGNLVLLLSLQGHPKTALIEQGARNVAVRPSVALPAATFDLRST